MRTQSIVAFLIGVLFLSLGAVINAEEKNLLPAPPPSVSEIIRDYKKLKPMTPGPIPVDPRIAYYCMGPTQETYEASKKRHGPHANTRAHFFMNEAAAAAYLGKQFPFPTGSVIVKEKSTDSPCVVGSDPARCGMNGLGGMVKRAPGYDPAHGDWEYFYSQDLKAVDSGKIQSCLQCHAGAAQTDYVFGNWGSFAPAQPMKAPQ